MEPNYPFCTRKTVAQRIREKALYVTISLGILGGLSSPAVQAETTTADFLKWERKAQETYFQVGISMAGVIASQFRPAVARCIDEWYFASKAIKAKRNGEMLKEMPKYAKFHPTAVVLGFVQQACGDIKP